MSRLKGGRGEMGCDKVWQGERKKFRNMWCHAFVKFFYRPKQCLSYLSVFDEMPTDLDTVEPWLLWLILFFYWQLLHVNCKIKFEVTMIARCIYAYIPFMGRWITFGWLGNFDAFGKMHTVEGEGGLWPVTHFSQGVDHVRQIVTEAGGRVAPKIL